MPRHLETPVPRTPRARRALVAALMLAAGLLAAPSKGDVVERVLAVVDGRLITLSDVHTIRTLGLVQAALGTADGADPIVERLIDRVLILQEVERYAPPAPDEGIIDARVRAISQAEPAPGPLAERLAVLGVSEAWLRQWIRDDLRIQAYIDQRFTGVVQPSNEELEAYFQEHSAEFAAGGRDLSDAAAQQLARERVTALRRQALLTDWVTGLRRRAEIVRPAAR
jgi:hypothetical protein